MHILVFLYNAFIALIIKKKKLSKIFSSTTTEEKQKNFVYRIFLFPFLAILKEHRYIITQLPRRQTRRFNLKLC